MKSLLIGVMLTSLAAPALAYDLTLSTGATSVSVEEIGRRSGNCPNRPEEPLLDSKSVLRWDYRSCGGV